MLPSLATVDNLPTSNYMLPPGIYYIKKYEIGNSVSYGLEKKHDRFVVPKKLYGNTMSNIIRVWNEYAISKSTTGVLLTGTKGSGKTTVGMTLSNIAIDNDIPVIMCIEIEFTIELIRFLAGLKQVVLFMDEFKKNVSYDMQSKSLSMLSDLEGTNKLIILTENNTHGMSELILDRPGRIRYHFDYKKLHRTVFEDYCKDHNVNDVFYADLKAMYDTYREFSFDQLQAIVSEHLHYPNETVDEILEVLNLHSLMKERIYSIVSIVNLTTNEDVKYNVAKESLESKRFENNYHGVNITLVNKPEGEQEPNGNRIPVGYANDEICLQFSKLKSTEVDNLFKTVCTSYYNKDNYEVTLRLEILN